MFGESDSESPRAPSPWDSLTTSPSSSPKHDGTPKLVPEVEEGNVEYKLQLLSPSPDRFVRLVTQLKWRLLEGGGQAYYELGVADSGTLVGLARQQLEESLETLEMMASEIGASVIVVKEIEVHPELSSLAESQPERWNGKRSTRRKDLLRRDASLATSATDSEIEPSHLTDVEDTIGHSLATSPTSPTAQISLSQFRSSHTPFPIDPALAIFTVDLGGNVVDYADDEGSDGGVPADCVSLQIISVYKPRPMRKRAMYTMAPPSTHCDHTRKFKNGYLPSKSINTPKGAKAQCHRSKQDKQRELKLSALPTHVSAFHSIGSPIESANPLVVASHPADETKFVAPEPAHTVVESPTDDVSETTMVASKEPRLIVEAMVVRKLLLDEAFLDFEGFSLQGITSHII